MFRATGQGTQPHPSSREPDSTHTPPSDAATNADPPGRGPGGADHPCDASPHGAVDTFQPTVGGTIAPPSAPSRGGDGGEVRTDSQLRRASPPSEEGGGQGVGVVRTLRQACPWTSRGRKLRSKTR